MPITREELVKKSIKGYMLVTHDKYEGIEFMLISVDFDAEILTLRMFPNDTYKVNNQWDEIHAHISHCSFIKPERKPKMKILK